jgi:hypothetical protein
MIFVAFLVPSLSHRHLRCHCLVYQRLVVTSGPSGVDARVDHRAPQALVPEQVFDARKISRVGVEHIFRGQVSELVRRDNDPCPP